MPSWKQLSLWTAVSVGATAMYFTCPLENTFSEFFEQWYNNVLWPLIKQKINGNNNGDQSNSTTENNLLKWMKSAANKATNAVQKNVLFEDMFPYEPQFETYHIFRVAKITMFIDQNPQGVQLVFIGVGNQWFLNPVQNVLLSVGDAVKQ
eukprot:55249_1